MEIATLKTDKRIYRVFCDDLEAKPFKIYGYYYENNTVYPLNNDFFKELEILKLGSNNKNIGIYEKNNVNYDIILDLDTNLKHYFYDGKENYDLFINNFEELIVADEIENNEDIKNDMQNNKRIILRLYLKIIVITCLPSIVIGKLISKIPEVNDFVYNIEASVIDYIDTKKSEEAIYKVINMQYLTVDDIKNAINSNKNISNEDKKILLNDDLLEFSIPYINENKEYSANLSNIIIPNLKIKKSNFEDTKLGTWNYLTRSINLNTKFMNQNYSDNYNSVYTDVLTHEWCHVLQADNIYAFLYEGCAEIISNEFLNDSCEIYPTYERTENGSIIQTGVIKERINSFDSYLHEQKYIKILIEIIGIEPILKYNYTGSIEPIKNELNEYLTKEDIDLLFDSFRYSASYISHGITLEQYNKNIQNIDVILNKLYESKYEESMRQNYMIESLLNENEVVYNKSYFNYDIKPSYSSDEYLLDNYKLLKNNNYKERAKEYVAIKDRTIECLELKNKFFNNKNLKEKEKSVLYNEEFFDDFIKYKIQRYNNIINSNNCATYLDEENYVRYLSNLSIIDYNCKKDINHDNYLSSSTMITNNNFDKCRIEMNIVNCYYYAMKNNLIYNEIYKKEMIEEFINNFCGDNNYKNIINQGCNHIILKEYYGVEFQEKDKYSEIEEKITKIFIDIVGIEPVKYYYFTGDNSLIKQELEKYKNINIDQVLNCLQSTIKCSDGVQRAYIYKILCYLYNNVNGTNYISDNFIDEYYIPETKGYFSNSYIEKNKHPEYYENNDLESIIGKSK